MSEALHNTNDFRRLVEKIEGVDKARSGSTLYRRLLKLYEELGELSRAYLSVTHPENPKGLNWNDVLEEATDVFIILVDCALTDSESQRSPKELLPSIMFNAWHKDFGREFDYHKPLHQIAIGASSAARALNDRNGVAFYGAIYRAVFSICNLLSHIPTTATSVSFEDTLSTKIGKWTRLIREKGTLH